MIALVDYGTGNLRSVEKALTAVGAEVSLTSDPGVILGADKVLLPGVGAFDDAMSELAERGLAEIIKNTAARGIPLLGICVGMQLLFEESEEHGCHIGLGLLPGRVQRFEMTGFKIPHTGWNRILPSCDNPLIHNLPPGAYAYFNHSYFCEATTADTLAYTEYGSPFSSIVGRGRLYGVQFHPEKSQQVGLTILRNFVESC